MGNILLPVYDSFTELAFQPINAVSMKKKTRIKMRFESMNLEKLFHMLHVLKEKARAQNYKNS